MTMENCIFWGVYKDCNCSIISLVPDLSNCIGLVHSELIKIIKNISGLGLEGDTELRSICFEGVHLEHSLLNVYTSVRSKAG